MARAGNRSMVEAAAKKTRRVDRRSCRSDRDRRLPWRRSLRRTRRAIDSSMRLLDSSRRVIDVSERSAARRPLRTSRQLQRAARWLTEAEARLQKGVHALRNTADDAARAPERAAAAPGQLIDAAARWLQSAAQIEALSERLEDASSRLIAAANIGAVCFDVAGDSRQTAAPRLTISVPDRRVTPESARTRISIRRQRPRPAVFADAVRRVFRGRAPPRAAICSF